SVKPSQGWEPDRLVLGSLRLVEEWTAGCSAGLSGPIVGTLRDGSEVAACMNLFKKRIGLARAQFRRWSLYGAPWLQTVAIVGKSRSRGSRRNSENHCDRLPPVA